MATWVTLSGGNAWGINMEGVIYRTGYLPTTYCSCFKLIFSYSTAGGHMIVS